MTACILFIYKYTYMYFSDVLAFMALIYIQMCCIILYMYIRVPRITMSTY